jgi:hypothetical protein
MGKNNFLQIYNLNNLESPSIKLINRGKGPNELLTFNYYGQYEKDSSNINIWFVDDGIGKRSIKMNLTKSVKLKKAVYGKTEMFSNIQHGDRFIINDTTFLYANSVQESVGNCYLSFYNTNRKHIYNKTELFENNFDRDQSDINLFRLKISPKKNKILFLGTYISRIGILSLNHERSYDIQMYNYVNEKSEFNINSIDNTIYYLDACVTEDFIYALYLDKSPNIYLSDSNEFNTEIHVFNWEGQAIGKIVTNTNIMHLELDEINNCLYGFKASNEGVYKYTIPNFKI